MVRVHAVTLLDVGVAHMFANQALNGDRGRHVLLPV